MNINSCCKCNCSPKTPKYIVGEICLNDNCVHKVNSNLTFEDKLGTFKARWGIGRMNYIVKPGLYAVGKPTDESNVFVSANYKMSFDKLRESLNGINAWILVLDTKGINVWCAAGKGTFGTNELVNRIDKTNLKNIISHKTIIVPELGAPGISAHEVQKLSGFRVIYGPVRSKDIKTFLTSGEQATKEMRTVKFPIKDRAELIPFELVLGAKYVFFSILFFLIFAGFSQNGFSLSLFLNIGIQSVFFIITSFLAGIILTPLLLPWLPGKPFALKGFWIGLLIILIAIIYPAYKNSPIGNLPTMIGWILIVPAIASFVSMNFTGSSTFTSLSGVKKEMKYAVPIQAVAGVLGVILWTIGRFI